MVQLFDGVIVVARVAAPAAALVRTVTVAVLTMSPRAVATGWSGRRNRRPRTGGHVTRAT